jgi:mRNA interferase MazF
MQSFSKNKIILVKYPFTDLADSKIRPAVIINESYHNDIFIVLLTSRTGFLTEDEFILQDWKKRRP